MIFVEDIFSIQTTKDFNIQAIKVFKHQAKHNKIYQKYINLLGIDLNSVTRIEEIPFLPIRFFKEFNIILDDLNPEKIFTSSGTSGMETSQHYVADLSVYQQSIKQGFKHFYGSFKDYTIFALLPSYLEREGSSLIDMVNLWINETKQTKGGFYLYNFKELYDQLYLQEQLKQKSILIGVTFALLDFAKEFPMQLQHTIVMETGGMKGRKEELTRIELHELLEKGFGTNNIHSEYGMTELLSQAYLQTSQKTFSTPPWMKILIRDIEEPLTLVDKEKTGGINIIDLANFNSCSFIATDDLGRLHPNNTFEVLGRFDNTDVRGCNLLVL